MPTFLQIKHAKQLQLTFSRHDTKFIRSNNRPFNMSIFLEMPELRSSNNMRYPEKQIKHYLRKWLTGNHN